MGGFTIRGSAGAIKQIVTPGSGSTTPAIVRSSSFKMADTDNTTQNTAYLEQSVASLQGNNAALRSLYKFYLRPTVDPIRFHGMLNGALTLGVYFRMLPTGHLEVWVDEVGREGRWIALNFRVPEEGRLDLESYIQPGKNGLLTVSAALGTKRREIIMRRHFDFQNATAHVMRPGIFGGGSANNRWNVFADNVVITTDGDVLDRERPISPPAIPDPVEDRPTATGGVPRRHSVEDKDRINQLRAFLKPGEGVERMNLLDEPVNVRPGVTYCVAAFCRWAIINRENQDGFGEIQIFLESDDPDLPRRQIAGLGEMHGKRGWHPTSREDDYAIFMVPDAPEDSPGYTRAVPELRMHPGFYVIQEFLFSQEDAGFTPEDMTFFALRDARRQGGLALTGNGEWILPMVPDHVGDDLPSISSGWWLSEVGVKEIPTITESGNAVEFGTLETEFATSADGVDFVPYTDPGDQAYRLMRIDATLTANATRQEGPVVPAGGIWVRSWTPAGMLCREDGSPFPGGAYVGNSLWISSYPRMDPRRVGDRLAAVTLSDVLDRLEHGFSVAVVTEDAIEEIEYLSQVGRLRLELPGLGNRVQGRALLVRCEEGIIFEPGLVRGTFEDFQIDRRFIHAVGTTGYAEVLQDGRLQRPMGRAAKWRKAISTVMVNPLVNPLAGP